MWQIIGDVHFVNRCQGSILILYDFQSANQPRLVQLKKGRIIAFDFKSYRTSQGAYSRNRF